MRKEIIEKILEEWNVCSCDNSALADRLLEEFSPAGEYIKKEDAISKILIEFVAREEKENVICACADVKQTCADILDGLPTYSFPDSADIEKIRAEIKKEYKDEHECMYGDGMRRCLEIIDKYIGGKDK